MSKSRQQGFTMVELILSIALLGAAIPPLMHLLSQTAIGASRTDSMPVASSLATEMMEQIKSRRFDELQAQVNNDWSLVLGPDAGEVDKEDFEDVDDFNGWSQDFAPNFSAYQAAVDVAYVGEDDLATPLGAGTSSYKRVTVTVTNSGLADSVTLTTLVTEVQSL